MEGIRMDYRFTALLIFMITLLALFGGPAHSKNEYLQNSRECGSVDFRVEQRDQDYNYSTSSTNEQSNYSMTFRKYLGTDCKTSRENVKIKQQLELMKMCGKVNNNPSLAHNENFNLLVSKCRGVTPTKIDNRPDSGSEWDKLKDDYKKENPDITLMGDKFLKKKKLKIPKYLTDENIVLPLPKPAE